MKVFAGLLFLVVGIAWVGCHKKGESAPGPAAANATNSVDGVAPPEPPQPPSREVLARADDKARETVVGEVDPFLTAQLRAFIEEKKRMPASFSELARARLDSVPRPPAGKKWAIDNDSLEIKAVAQ
ncbi:MAG TPA: hypothetical protein VJA21_27010 [Verrucomicrobiae bacterium]